MLIPLENTLLSAEMMLRDLPLESRLDRLTTSGRPSWAAMRRLTLTGSGPAARGRGPRPADARATRCALGRSVDRPAVGPAISKLLFTKKLGMALPTAKSPTFNVVGAVGVLGVEDSLDDLGIEIDLDALDGEEELDDDVAVIDEESA